MTHFNLKNSVKVAIAAALFSSSAMAANVINSDQVVKGSECIGVDCATSPSFGFDTLRLKENNLRIKFDDSSASGSFPNNDWMITANDSSNGGANKFSVDDVTGGKTPFTIEAASPNNSLFVASEGRIGIGTSTPAVDLHIVEGNSPSLRLEQVGSSGFTAQTWDVAANETNFFIRDVTNSSKLPFRIKPGASKNSLFIAADGDIGFETETPDGLLDIADPDSANNHAFLVDPEGDVGININNGGTVSGLLDIHNSGSSVFNVSADGDVGIGTSSFTQYDGLDPILSIEGKTGEHNVVQMNVSDSALTSSLSFTDNGASRWFFSSRNSWNSGGNAFYFMDANYNTTMSLQQGGKIGFGVGAVNAAYAIEHSNGAHLTTGGVWTNASSRQLKQEVMEITTDDAKQALNNLNPVTYAYKSQPEETYAGFIAEDVPEIVAMNDRKSLASMDIVAVLTKVVKDQQKLIEQQNERLAKLEAQAAK